MKKFYQITKMIGKNIGIKMEILMYDLATKKKGTVYIHGRTDDVINIRGKNRL